jgi:hypothetical protein
MDTRKEYEELVKRPVADETLRDADADHPANDENLKHRENFKSLATLAARKREPKG